MSDLPAQGILQQLAAKPVSGEHLEVLGKKASADWSSGEYDTLNEAVVETVKQAGLSPEQVKRVIEFANTDAYLRDFKKEGSAGHRVVNFHGGPADPSVIFKDLNDGGGGTVFDRGTSDYDSPPEEKRASDDGALEEMFKSASAGYEFADPLAEANATRLKLAGALDAISDQISGLEVAFGDLGDRMFEQVKQACLHGYSLGDVLHVMSQAESATQEHVKVAFASLAPRLVSNGVIEQSDLAASIQKVSSTKLANSNHPLVQDFNEYCDTLSKLAEYRTTQRELAAHTAALTNFVKQAAQGIIPKVMGASKAVGEAVGKPVGAAVTGLTGRGDYGRVAQNVVAKGIHMAPVGAALVGANEVRRHLKYNPTYHKAMGLINPVSSEYDAREAEIAAQYGQYPR